MKILGLVCSPRKGGNTEILVREALDAASSYGAQTEMIRIAEKNIAPCDGCESCMVTGKCKIADDMQDIYDKLVQSDGIIFGSPVYFWGVTAQGKAVIDRTFVLRKNKPLRNKVAGAVVVARNAGGSSAFNLLQAYFNMMGMMPARSIGPRTEEEITKERRTGVIAYADKRGDARQNQPAIDAAQALGRAMVETIELLKKK